MKTIILAGGSGTRLFPLSRTCYPKQFIPLPGKESLFQRTVLRALLFSSPDEVYVITGVALSIPVRPAVTAEEQVHICGAINGVSAWTQA